MTLWPPNHRLVEVGVEGVPEGVVHELTHVVQNEPTNDTGDGDTAPDAILRRNSVLLRAERSGNHAGRLYCVDYRLTNTAGTCTGIFRVVVPKNQGKNQPDWNALPCGAIDSTRITP